MNKPRLTLAANETMSMIEKDKEELRREFEATLDVIAGDIEKVKLLKGLFSAIKNLRSTEQLAAIVQLAAETVNVRYRKLPEHEANLLVLRIRDAVLDVYENFR